MHYTGVSARAAASENALTTPMGSALFGSYLALFAIGYYFAVLLGLEFRFQHSQIGAIWPANALLVSALVLTPRRRWCFVLAAMVVAHTATLSHIHPTWWSAWAIPANALFAGVTVEALRRFAGFPLHFDNRRQSVAFIAISAISPIVFSLTAPAFLRALLGSEPYASPAAAMLRITLTNAVALLLVVPVVLLWATYSTRAQRHSSARSLLEAAAIMVLLVGVGLFAFGTGPAIARVSSLLWFFPPLLWAAVRFGPIGASTALFTIAALSLGGTARQLGPFVLPASADQVLSLQLFWIVLYVPVMLLAAVIRERDKVEAALEEQRNELAHVTRIMTVGELSGALAHELSQPVAAILANAQTATHLLTNRPDDVEQLSEILADIIAEDRQAAAIIQRLKFFLKHDTSRFETLAVDNVVRDALALGRSTIEMSGVDVQTRIEAGIPQIRGDHVQLLQVVLNLIVNACESMSVIHAHDRHLHLRLAPRGTDQVELQIMDRGVGLPRGYEDNVFEPFFTTKENGLGLGLAISRSIVAAHHGQLRCANNSNGGATFHLVLPVAGSYDNAVAAA